MHALRFAQVSFLLAALAHSATAQVTAEWERFLAASANPNLAIEACASRSGGGFYAAGAEYEDLVNIPGPNYVSADAFLLRLDDAGQVVWSRTANVASLALTQPVVVATDSAGAAYLGYRAGTPRIVKYAEDGVELWSRAVAGATSFVRGGLRATIGGTIVGVVVSGGTQLAVVGFDAAGNPLYTTTPVSTTSQPGVAAIDAVGRAAAHSPTEIFVVQPGGSLGWSAPLDFTVHALEFGGNGELAAAGNDASNDPIVRLYDVAGNVLWTRVAPQGQSALWSSVAFDRWGGVALAGTGGSSIDASDALVALYAADGTPAWLRAWDGAGFGDAFERVLVTSTGEVHVAGRTYATSANPYYQTQRNLVVAEWNRAGGLSWTHVAAAPWKTCAALLEGAGGSIVSFGGRYQQNFVNPGDTPTAAHVLSLRPQARALCFGDTQSAACPCGNASSPGAQEGCANSTGHGSRLLPGGIASLSADTLTLTVVGTTPSAPGLYFQGSIGPSPTTFGDGLRCAGGALLRLFTRQATGGTSSVPSPGDPSVSARAAAAGDLLVPGATRVYQVHHRDLNAAFCPPPVGASSNASSAVLVTWGV